VSQTWPEILLELRRLFCRPSHAMNRMTWSLRLGSPMELVGATAPQVRIKGAAPVPMLVMHLPDPPDLTPDVFARKELN
jgi:hypothetical protein